MIPRLETLEIELYDSRSILSLLSLLYKIYSNNDTNVTVPVTAESPRTVAIALTILVRRSM
jgi:hypothetical protein